MASGGESLTAVIGRREEEELPAFQEGAFEVDGGGFVDRKFLVDREFLDRFVPRGEVTRHTMRDLIGKIRIVGGKDFECDEVRGVESLGFFVALLLWRLLFSGWVVVGKVLNCHGLFTSCCEKLWIIVTDISKNIDIVTSCTQM